MRRNNLAQGRDVTIANAVSGVVNESERFLTNGVTGEISKQETWLGFDGGIVVELTVDLGDIYAVEGFDIGFLHDSGFGIYCPDEVRFFLSENGNDFLLAETVSAPYPASFGIKTRASYRSSTEDAFCARFVKIEFGVENRVCCDELRVFGNSPIGFEKSLSGLALKSNGKDGFASRKSLGDVCDVPLISYAHLSEDGETSRLGFDDLVPILAYVDNDGTVKDLMFDSVALCNSFVGNCPSGGCITHHRAETSLLSDWEWLIDELFAENSNLKALNNVGDFIKKSLSLPVDYKFKVYLSSPVPKTAFKPFGDMNGDGIEEKLLTGEDCVAAFSWFVDAVARRFEAECLQNLVIEGFVWNNNHITREKRDDEITFASGCVSELHSRGYKCLFVTDCVKGGCDRSDEIGFDCTAIRYEVEEFNVDALCRKYGFGVALQSSFGILNPQTKNKCGAVLYSQLRNCAENGMMTDTVHVYDQAIALSICATSPDEYLRGIYDDLYRFIKGILFEQERLASVAEPEVETEIFEIQNVVEDEIAEFESVVSESNEPEIAECENKEACLDQPEPVELELVEEPVVVEESEITEPDFETVQLKEAIQPDEKPDEEPVNLASDESKNGSEITIKIEIEKADEPSAKKEETVEEPKNSRCCYEMPPRCPKVERCCQTDNEKEKREQRKKLAYLGLGIAATLGAAYLITKITKGKN